MPSRYTSKLDKKLLLAEQNRTSSLQIKCRITRWNWIAITTKFDFVAGGQKSKLPVNDSGGNFSFLPGIFTL